ncbi:hydroxymethylglutaryl-CoA synthase [Actinotignum urinale]|uniref:hydroxymethylglutaryl-CoA synthase n=1 Tax=Actinotignum urinale TaxID=190146 RepID=UPI000C7FE5A1|nr:hydroxymethylglutaryl-CoA synthase [Actinotignum urinale]WIK58541.1 hydroxymethylglutaryl-CoA synthase [Actinotignum urinale]
MVSVGIDALALATTHVQVPLSALADALDVPVGKYHKGLGQERMSIPALDEDAITMGAEAATKLLAHTGTDGIRTLLYASESGVDQSKAGGVFIHGILGLPRHIRTVELKEACYGGTAALQTALAFVARNPEEKALVIASDIARYTTDESGEPTQGAGAVAMLVSANPRLVEIEPVSGVYTLDINDFWRPNDSSTPYVHGHVSMDAYMDAFTGAWDDYRAYGGRDIGEFARFVHHQPFGKMARKAHARLMEYTGVHRQATNDTVNTDDSVIEAGLIYGRHIGNSYTAALYIGLASLLGNDSEDLTHKKIGMFSYGSGAVSEFFCAVPQPGYREVLAQTGADARSVMDMLDARTEVDFRTYRVMHAALRTDSEDFETPSQTTGPYRWAGVQGKIRRYSATS